MNSFDLSDDHKILGILISQDWVDIYHAKSLHATKTGDIFLRMSLLKGKDIDRSKIDHLSLSCVAD